MVQHDEWGIEVERMGPFTFYSVVGHQEEFAWVGSYAVGDGATRYMLFTTDRPDGQDYANEYLAHETALGAAMDMRDKHARVPAVGDVHNIAPQARRKYLDTHDTTGWKRGGDGHAHPLGALTKRTGPVAWDDIVAEAEARAAVELNPLRDAARNLRQILDLASGRHAIAAPEAAIVALAYEAQAAINEYLDGRDGRGD